MLYSIFILVSSICNLKQSNHSPNEQDFMVLWITPRSFAIPRLNLIWFLASVWLHFLSFLPSIFGYQEHCNALYFSNASSFPWLGTFALQLDPSLDNSFSFWSQLNIAPQRLFPWPSHLKYICFQLLSTTILYLTAFIATTTPWNPLVFLFISSLSQFIKTWAVPEQGHWLFYSQPNLSGLNRT